MSIKLNGAPPFKEMTPVIELFPHTAGGFGVAPVWLAKGFGAGAEQARRKLIVRSEAMLSRPFSRIPGANALILSLVTI